MRQTLVGPRGTHSDRLFCVTPRTWGLVPGRKCQALLCLVMFTSSVWEIELGRGKGSSSVHLSHTCYPIGKQVGRSCPFGAISGNNLEFYWKPHRRHTGIVEGSLLPMVQRQEKKAGSTLRDRHTQFSSSIQLGVTNHMFCPVGEKAGDSFPLWGRIVSYLRILLDATQAPHRHS